MAASLNILGVYIEIFFVFLLIILIGIPVSLFILRLLDENCEKINLPKKKRIWIAILTNIIIFLVSSIYLYIDASSMEPEKNDYTFDRVIYDSGVSFPSYSIKTIEYPVEENQGDDYCVKKTLEFISPPSQNSIEQLEKLCQEDDRWEIEGDVYHYHEDIIDEELILDVVIDAKNNKVSTKYIKW